MGRKYAIRNQEGLHFVTFTVVYWLDIFTIYAVFNAISHDLEISFANKQINPIYPCKTYKI